MRFSFDPQFDWQRRALLRSTAAGGAIILAGGSGALLAQTIPADTTATTKKPKVDKGPQIEATLVKEFVTVAHGNLDAVKQLLAFQPALLNSVWDWGGGDYESGIEGASHVGNREIALYLLEQGARPTMFMAAMLGHLEIVKNFLTAYPALINCKGPHGLSLIHHARKGGEPAQPVLAYLESLGAM